MSWKKEMKIIWTDLMVILATLWVLLSLPVKAQDLELPVITPIREIYLRGTVDDNMAFLIQSQIRTLNAAAYHFSGR
jgi:hypothetical protein